jgi:hypothetical protein
MSEPKPKPTMAVVGRYIVRCFGRLRCDCGRVIQANDVDLDDGRTALICEGCFYEHLLIEPAP